MDNKTINQISGILENIKKENITEEKKIAVKDGDYIVIHFSGNYQPSVTIVKSSEFNNYFSEDMGFEVRDIKHIKNLKSGDTMMLEGDIRIVKM